MLTASNTSLAVTGLRCVAAKLMALLAHPSAAALLCSSASSGSGNGSHAPARCSSFSSWSSAGFRGRLGNRPLRQAATHSAMSAATVSASGSLHAPAALSSSPAAKRRAVATLRPGHRRASCNS